MDNEFDDLSGTDELRAWLSRSGPIASVTVRHHMLVQQQAGVPLPSPKRAALLDPAAKARLAAAVAVERTLYRGIESRYALARGGDRDALLRGLAHGFRFDDLRITDESIERCVERDEFIGEGCEYFEFGAGRWSVLDEGIRRAAMGKADGDDDVTLFFPVPLRRAGAPRPSPRGYVGDVLDRLEQAGMGGRSEPDGVIGVIVRGAGGSARVRVDTANDAAAIAALIVGEGKWSIPAELPPIVPLLPLVIWPEGPDGPKAYDPVQQYELD